MKHFIFISVLILLWAFIPAQNHSGFTKEIPSYGPGQKDIFYTEIRKFEKLANLDTLENGFDSLQIRIWYNFAKTRVGKQIFSIKRKNKTWEGTLYTNFADSLKKVKPKSGWDNFMKNIFSYDVMTLPNMDDIKGLEDDWIDGEGYSVEISDKRHYRLYNYHVPAEFKKFKDVKKMLDILYLIKDEFGIGLAFYHHEK